MQRNVVLLSKTIVAQHFKLLTGLCHLCNFKFLSIGQHASRNCRARRSCSDHRITVKLFDQTLLADMEMLHINETVFGLRDGAPLMDCTHPCLVALAAASHWPLHSQ
jgi:hypothetical protein